VVAFRKEVIGIDPPVSREESEPVLLRCPWEKVLRTETLLQSQSEPMEGVIG